MVDLGSGALVDMARFGLPHEPTPRETLAHGASLVTFSGDKLLGGPQAGIVVGRKDLVARLRKPAQACPSRGQDDAGRAGGRACGCIATPTACAERLTTLRVLTRPPRTSAPWPNACSRDSRGLGERAQVTVEDCASQIGSGAQPVERLPSAALVMRPAQRRGAGSLIAQWERALRELPVPVIGRIEDGALRLDLRCVENEAELAS